MGHNMGFIINSIWNNNFSVFFISIYFQNIFSNRKSFFAKVDVNSEQSDTINIVATFQGWIDNFVVSIFQLPDFSCRAEENFIRY